MKILAFDTTNNTASVAISQGETILAYIEELRPSMQAERIMYMIEEALNIAKLSYHDIDYLIVTNGPGSFTGIRIGLSVAQGILLSANIKGGTISNFEIAYFRAISQIKTYHKIFIFLNAYRGQLYSQIFTHNATASNPTLHNYDEAIAALLQAEDGIKICAGSGIELIYNDIKDVKDLIILPRHTRIKAWHICKYVAGKIAQGQDISSHVEPLYIRPSDAKVTIFNN